MKGFNSLNVLVSLIVVGFMLVASYTYTRAADEQAAASETVTVELKAVNDSGVSGKATLTPMDNKTMVTIDLTGAPQDIVQPAHIHQGTCENLGAPKYPLEAVKNGKSETTIDAKLSDLTAGDLAINIHKSEEEMSVYAACGEISKS
jgi:hypothetical protein